MNSYDLKRQTRLPLVQALYAIGFEASAIARYFGLGAYHTIVLDLDSIDHGQARNISRKQLFANALRRYAALSLEDQCSNVDLELQRHLAVWLRVDTVNTTLRSLDGAQALLINAQGEPDGCVRLVYAIFGTPMQDDLGSLWTHYLKCIVAGTPPPHSHRELLDELIRWHVRAWRREIRPIWPPNAGQVIEYLLATLMPREDQLLRLRFGIGQTALTLREVAELWDVSTERIRQVEAKALRKLRHPSRRRILEPLARPYGVASVQLPEPRSAQKPSSQERLENLLRNLDEIEWSVRAYNCLIDALGLRKVWQLCEKTEWELMATRNIGRRSLKEVKEALTEMGLTLGMPFGEDERIQLMAKTNPPPPSF